MSKKVCFKPLAVAVSAAVAGSLLLAPVSNASPFGMTVLGSGYMADMGEGKCGEGKCGGEKADTEEAGGAHEGMEDAEHAEGMEDAELAEGDADDKADAEGKCGGEKTEGEGKCGGGTL